VSPQQRIVSTNTAPNIHCGWYYHIVFPEREKEQKKKEDDREEQVYEVGAGGFKISE
jgi:hypothetical protein